MSGPAAPGLLAAIVEASPCGLLLTDAEGTIVLVNREIERIFGHARDALLGARVEMLLPTGARARHIDQRRAFRGAPEAGRPMGGGREVTGLRADGSEVALEVGLTRLPGPEAGHVLAAVVDVSERRLAEERFEAVFEAAPAGMILVDPGGIVERVNRQIEHMFRCARDTLVGTRLDALVAEGRKSDFRAFLEDHRQQSGRNEPEPPTEFPGLRPDGTALVLDVGLTAIPGLGSEHLMAVITDATARKRDEERQRILEEQLRYTQHMQSVSRLAGGFAHDFNNILATVLGSAELALESGPDPEIAGDLEMVVGAAERGKQIVEGLLRFSRHRSLDLRNARVADLIRGAESFLRESLPSEIRLDVSATCEDQVIADPAAIHQLLHQLVANAARSMPGGGAIRITCQSLGPDDPWSDERSRVHGRRHAAITIRDTGRGSPSVPLDDVLERHVIGQPPSSSLDAMGFAVAHAIMDEHGGALEVRGVAGEGTTVRCILPSHGIRPLD